MCFIYKSAEAAISATHASKSKDIPENRHTDRSHAQSIDCTETRIQGEKKAVFNFKLRQTCSSNIKIYDHIDCMHTPIVWETIMKFNWIWKEALLGFKQLLLEVLFGRDTRSIKYEKEKKKPKQTPRHFLFKIKLKCFYFHKKVKTTNMFLAHRHSWGENK